MDFSDYKKSGIIHKIIRNEINKLVKPGILLFDIRKQIEKLINRFSHLKKIHIIITLLLLLFL